MTTIDYYFWLSSDWSFLGHERLHRLAAYHGATIRYRPVRHRDLFAATGGQLLGERSSQRQAYRETELRRWCDRLAFPLNLSPRHFPVDNEAALRVVTGAARNGFVATGTLIEAYMRAVWQEERNIADNDVVIEIAAEAGLHHDQALRSLADPAVTEELGKNVRSAEQHGVFGAPSYVVNGIVFWGQDRLDFLAQHLLRLHG